MSAEESITQQIFSDPELFDEVNELVRDILGYRKNVMRVWLNKPQIDSLRSVFPNLPPSVTIARETILSKLDTLPLCQSSDPETAIDRLKNFLRMTQKHHSTAWVAVDEKKSENLKDDEIKRLLELFIKNYKPPQQEGQ